MASISLPTRFAPAERATTDDIQSQSALVARIEHLNAFLDVIPNIIVVLNRQRQIVFANRPLLDLLGLKDANELLGLRPGEALHCIHAGEVNGCGTAEACSTCGAVLAILGSQDGKIETRECRVTQQSGNALDLRVWAAPVTVHGESFTVFAVANIGDEKRRRVLERLFFHDILNTAGNVFSYAELLQSANHEELEEYKGAVRHLAEMLIDEIHAQQQLLAAESHELQLQVGTVDALVLLRETIEAYQSLSAAQACALRIAPEAQPATLVTDRTLLRRVLGNLTKNAVEASHKGEVVTLSCRPEATQVLFTVHNPAVMPQDVQLQVFQRSFSTKGTGRGLGTYSIKLLSERYLRGRVSFTSTPETGTVFTVVYPTKL